MGHQLFIFKGAAKVHKNIKDEIYFQQSLRE